MNLLVFGPDQLIGGNLVSCRDYQRQHVQKILKAEVGDVLRVGELNGKVGEARIRESSPCSLILEILCLHQDPPPLLPLSIVLALPRPQMLKRILQSVATLGIKEMALIHSARVEKSYWQSPCLQANEIEKQLLLGLEQGMAVQMPIISLHRNFAAFMREGISPMMKNRRCLLAHKGGPCSLETTPRVESLVAIGPEGGFVGTEVDAFVGAKFDTLDLGARVLKVETALPLVAGKFTVHSGFHA